MEIKPKLCLSIGIVIYEGFDSLDVAAPNQIFFLLKFWRPEVNLYLIGPEGKEVTSLEGLTWKTELDYQSAMALKLDVIFVPGGNVRGLNNLIESRDDPFYAFLKKQAASAKLVCSVCTGALLLARAGLLDGYTCTTHWAYKNALSLFPGVIVAPGFPRFIIDENRITGGGISSGIDQALAIVEILYDAEIAKRIQLFIQYAPNPIHNSGDPSVASPTTLYAVSTKLDTSQMYELVKKIYNKEAICKLNEESTKI